MDIYGEAVYALAQTGQVANVIGFDDWRHCAALLDWLCEHWDRPDEGIWETRGGRKDFTHSRLHAGSPSTAASARPSPTPAPATCPAGRPHATRSSNRS